MRNNILLFGLIESILYSVSTLAFKYLNVLHIWPLRIVNFIILGIVAIIQIRRWIIKSGGYVPFLQAFCTAFFTGIWSFFLFAILVFAYSFYDPYLAKLFFTESNDNNKAIPAIIVFFEGSGASIIVSLIAMIYASKFEEGEAALPR